MPREQNKNGTKKGNEKMNKESKETLKKVAEYAASEKNALAKKICGMTGGALLLLVASEVMQYTELANRVRPYQNFCDFAMGLAIAAMGLNILYFLGVFDKIAAWKGMRKESR